MSRENAKLGRWREGQAIRSRPSRKGAVARKWTRALALMALLTAAAAGIVYVVTRLLLPPLALTHEIVPFFVAGYERPSVPPLPAAELDRDAIGESGAFRWREEDKGAADRLTGEVVKERLDGLAREKAKDVLIVYIAGHAVVDDETGNIRLMAYDSDSRSPATLIPLRTVLDSVGKSRAPHRLLILDMMSSPADALALAGVADGVSDLLAGELEDEGQPGRLRDPGLLVLSACAPGEIPLRAETLSGSAFGHFLREAFRDPEADTNHDRAVSVKELAGYLGRNVDRWARQHRGTGQRPILIGKAADFTVAPLQPRGTSPSAGWPWSRSVAGTDRASLGKDEPAGAPKPSEKVAEPEKPAGKDKAAPRDGDAAGDKGKEKTKAAPAEPPEAGYPAWLAEGWATLRRWWDGPELHAAPRVFRRLEAQLLRAERSWRIRSKTPAAPAGLEEEQASIRLAMAQAQRQELPPIRSAGQAFALGQPADPALVKGLKELLKQRRQPAPFVPPDKVKADLDAASKAFLGALKDKNALDLAKVICEAVDEERLDPSTLGFLDSLVAQSLLPPRVVELRLLQQLARRAARSPASEWDADTAKLAWETVILSERAANRPASLAWVRSLLEQADAQLHEAQTLLLPEAVGYATRAQVARAWAAVQETYASLDGSQRAILDARATLDRARACLPAMIAYLEESDRSEPAEAIWLEAAATAHDLDRLLERPSETSSPGGLTRDGLGLLVRDLAGARSRLDGQLTELLRPFQSPALAAFVRDCQADRPEPGLGRELEAILATPFPQPADREKLWRAARTLDEKLAGYPPDRGSVATPDPGPTAERIAAIRRLASRRVRRLEALRGLIQSGLPADRAEPAPEAGPTPVDAAADRGAPARVWGTLARSTQSFRARLEALAARPDRADRDDTAGWLAPPYSLELEPNPVRRQLDADHQAGLAWLAAHYRHKSLDLRDLIDRDRSLYEATALELAPEGPGPSTPVLEMGAAEDGHASVSLSGSDRDGAATVRVVFRGVAGSPPVKVALKVLAPDDRRLRVGPIDPPEIELAVQTPATIRVPVTWSEDGSTDAGPTPEGFIVQAQLPGPGQRPYHWLVPLKIVSETSRPRLVLATDPAAPDDLAIDRLALRTLAGRQPYFVKVRNPSTVSRDVIVEVLAGDRVIASSGPKAVTVGARSTVAIAGFGTPAPKPDAPLAEIPPRLRFRLRDVAADRALDEPTLRVEIASPLEYLEVARARFVPARPGMPNRLEVSLQALAALTGPPCPVRLIIPTDKELFPGFRAGPEGRLDGSLTRGGALDLFAQNIAVDPAADDDVRFPVSVDGFERALWFRTKFAAEGPAQLATPYREPRVRFTPELTVKPDQPARLRVKFAVDNAPPASRLAFRLGQHKGGRFVDSIEPVNLDAMRRHIGFDAGGENGALLFEAKVEDWSLTFDVPRIRGKCHLYAWLLESRKGTELAHHDMELILDDQPPQNLDLVVPGEIRKAKGAKLDVKLTIAPPLPPSGIKDVSFLLGQQADFAKPDAEAKAKKGEAEGNDRGTWKASLPLPLDAAEKVVVTARVTNGVGLSSLVSEEVAVLEPPPPPADDAPPKPKPDLPGIIEGKVTENGIPQPSLKVYLINPKPKPDESAVVQQATTNAEGGYQFKDVKPGNWTVYCVKQVTGRLDTKGVTLESGQTLKQDMKLLLP